WQATETGLRAAMEPPAPPPDPADTLEDRAIALRTMLLDPAAQARSMQTFIRLNTEPVSAPRFEVELSGASDIIYAFRVSAVSASNRESPRSDAVSLFAVPHRNTPGQPRLLLRPLRPTGGIRVIALPG